MEKGNCGNWKVWKMGNWELWKLGIVEIENC